MNKIYYEPAGRIHSSQWELINYPPDGYQFITSKTLLDRKVVGSDLIFHKLRLSVLDKLMPLNLAKAWLDSHLRKLPDDIDLVYAYNHPIFRSIPWIVHVEWAHILIGRDLKYFSRYKRRVENLLSSSYCRKILTWTETAKKSILLNFNYENFESKMEVIPPAVHSKPFIKPGNGRNIKLLFVGTSNDAVDFKAKGGVYLLEVFNSLKSRYDNLELIIRAKVPDSIRLRYQGISNIKIIEEIVPLPVLEKLFQEATIFLFPSHLFQNTVVLEAMSYGIPVITTSIGSSNGEYIEDGVTGFVIPSPKEVPYFTENFILTSETIHRNSLVETAQVIEPRVVNELAAKVSLLIENHSLREQIGKAAWQEVESGKFSIGKRNEKLRRIFEEAINPK